MEEMFALLNRLDDEGVIMGASIVSSAQEGEMMLPNGLVAGHAFSLLAVTMAKLADGGEVRLVRLRNPWGDDHEWNGAWSDKCKLWEEHPEVDDHVERLLGHPRDPEEDDGIFWMSWEDFGSIFTRIETCQAAFKTRASRGELFGGTMSMGHTLSEYYSKRAPAEVLSRAASQESITGCQSEAKKVDDRGVPATAAASE